MVVLGGVEEGMIFGVVTVGGFASGDDTGFVVTGAVGTEIMVVINEVAA
jgi:hypothetical protein